MQISTYDFFETSRQYNEWIGSSLKTFWGNPIFGLNPSPIPQVMFTYGKLTEHYLSRVTSKPDWGINSFVANGNEYSVSKKVILKKPFCELIKFETNRKKANIKKVLIIAPMSGHYATLTRNTVLSLLPDCEVFVTDWLNARDVSLSKGKFDIEDFTKYLIEFYKFLSPDLNVMAICQPAPLALAALSFISKNYYKKKPSTLTLIGGPIDPEANPTSVTDFGNKLSLDYLKNTMTMPVGVNYKGVGRSVYPGIIQLSSFISMNFKTHLNSFFDQVFKEIEGIASENDRHNKFYNEYLAVMDMTAEFYLTTVNRIFKKREIAKNIFSLENEVLDLNDIKDIPIFIIEGKNDDISAPGQCLAALEILKKIPDNLKFSYLHENAGHYGIFSGKAWREDIRPEFINFINKF